MPPNVPDQKTTSAVLQAHLAENDAQSAQYRSTETPRYLEYIQQKLARSLENKAVATPAACCSILALMIMIGYCVLNCYGPGATPANNSTMWPVASRTPRGGITGINLQVASPASHTLPAESNRPIKKAVDRLLVVTGRRAPDSRPTQHNINQETPAAAADSDPDADALLVTCSFIATVVCAFAVFEIGMLVYVTWTWRAANRMRRSLAVARRLMRALASGTDYLPLQEVRQVVESGDMDAADWMVAVHNRGTEGSFVPTPTTYYGAITT